MRDPDRGVERWQQHNLWGGGERARDAVGVRCSPVRDRDQMMPADPEGEPDGELICRLMEGRNGAWIGHDGKGRILRIKRAKDGALEIRHVGERAGDNADPDIVGAYPATGVDPGQVARTGDAMSEYQRTQDPTKHMAALGAYQARLNEYYGRG